VFVRFGAPNAAGAWLSLWLDQIARGQPAAKERALQIAFTPDGLAALGLRDHELSGFAREFLSGMVGPHRSRFLGDVGDSAPERWLWGGPNNKPAHALLMLFAQRADGLVQLHDELRRSFATHRVEEVFTLPAAVLSDHEHFGFADGISQPAIQGYHETRSQLHAIKPGEFLLGYPNEYGLCTERPLLPAARDPLARLPLDVEGSPRHDLGRNGTYVVVRQLRQDVPLFRQTLDQLTRKPNGASDSVAQAQLAAQMVGRWPSGASLVEAPYADDPSKARANEFRYQTVDPTGTRCPIGAHVRRANPRDALAPHPGTEYSLEVNRHHRLIRRGRAYGTPLAAGGTDNQDRGLMFIGVNANITRQFEFIQHSWLMDPRFNGLSGQADPLLGAIPGNRFTSPPDPVSTQHIGLPRFVNVVGGGYFFLPGLRALRFLAELSS
jgi:Dyp-type peroxidase family